MARVHSQYPTVFIMATVYARIGVAVTQHLDVLDVDLVETRTKWNAVKEPKQVAFQLCDGIRDMYDHIIECIEHDRLLKKVAEYMPDIHPWKDAERYFDLRPPANTPTLPLATIAMYVRRYDTTGRETAKATIDRITASIPRAASNPKWMHSKARLEEV
jgi:hypothetical protein